MIRSGPLSDRINLKCDETGIYFQRPFFHAVSLAAEKEGQDDNTIKSDRPTTSIFPSLNDPKAPTRRRVEGPEGEREQGSHGHTMSYRVQNYMFWRK